MSIISRIKACLFKDSSLKNFENTLSNTISGKDIKLMINDIEITISPDNDVTINGIRILQVNHKYMFLQGNDTPAAHINELRALAVQNIDNPEVVAAKAAELAGYRLEEMGLSSKIWVEESTNHSLIED